ncbi:tetratricopeptide repeat protein [Actinophytocola algeriensis]|uniref:Tetratricopeptide (TPR) repeat protein n=1 Tax=Actinophytocola algeriensis TaxID=1768010 RepID=A0A7W7PZZ3_9PSEU|nr:tetratricopeptide repeat protein [Actinophytocola algeriensis]MBB4904442.1 tetratricopeptide (TPR) repeat protein [Actinophytocola algeriensis]MBE1476699.1 tetratricopeptide (TPR) repeat protein [Actinophytocola algeriensis]
MAEGSIEAVFVRAARLVDEGRPRAAIAVLESVLEVYPDNAAAWCRLSAAYLEVGEPSEALTAAKRAMTLGQPAWAHRLASLALVELDRHDEAVVSAGEAVRREPDDWRGLVTLSEALAHSEPEQAVRAARAAVALTPGEARTHEVLGDAAMLAHDWMLAEQSYREALRLDPANTDVADKVARLEHRPSDDARRKRKPVRTRGEPGFERVQRIAWYLAVRRAAVWQAVLVVVLVFASLAWVGLGALLFVGVLAWRGFAGLPPGARRPLPALWARARLVVVSGAACAGSYVALLVWTVVTARGGVFVSLLVVAFCLAVVAVANSWFGLWRMWSRAR